MAMCQQEDSLIWNGPVFTLDEEKSDMKFVHAPKTEKQATRYFALEILTPNGQINRLISINL